MKLEVYKALWGMAGTLEEQLGRIAAAGYDGIEVWPEFQIQDKAQLLNLVAHHRLKLIVAGLIPEAAQLEDKLAELASYQPVKINVQGGRDAMPFDEGCAFFQQALKVETALGVAVCHETHRGKLLFTPWGTAAYLQQFPSLKLTADYSHWVNVCERLPEDQHAALALANAQARHVHGRVGYEQGPQAPDPAAPEYARQLAWHETQWQHIWQHQQASGTDTFTFTPEYGPPFYLHTLPHTHVPVADLWQVCLWGAARARAHFGALDGAAV
ncbi:MAG: sugar phosphate isomerase/epimerase family protein [Phototrophicaceae bacterium]